MSVSSVSKPPSCDFDLLSENLRVISEAFHSRKFLLETEPKQIAFFDQRSLRGKFWGLFNRVIYCSNGDSESRKKTFISIRCQLQAAVRVLEEKDEKFRKAIATEGQKYTQQQEAIYRLCSAFFLFSPDSTTSIQTRLYPIQEMFKLYGFSDPLITQEQICALERTSIDYAMTAVLSRAAKPFPMAAFRKILNSVKFSQPVYQQGSETLTSDQQESLSTWIKSVQRSMAYISPGILHKALQGCVSIIENDLNPYSPNVQDKVSQIGWYLVNLKETPLKLLLEDDRDHLQWILATACQKVEFPLAHKQVVYSSIQNEKFSLYENAADTYVLMANNRFRLGLWDAVCRYQAWSVEPLERKFKDPQGKFFVIEKVDYTLASYTYKSQDTVVQDDVLLLHELACLLNFWAQHTKIPEKIALDTLFVKVQSDNTLILKVFIPIEWQKTVLHDFSRLEQFAWQFAKGNVAIFTYLMQMSRLSCHSVATILYSIYYRKLTDADRIALNIEAELGIEEIKDSLLARCVEQVLHELKKAQEAIYARILPHVKMTSLQEVAGRKKQIAIHLVEFHKKTCFCTQVHPKLFDEDTLQSLANAIIQAK